MRRLEWPTIVLIVLCYGGWMGAGFWLWPVAPWAALPLMAVLTALQSSLVHECLHGHPTRNRLVNEALVFWPLFLIYPYRRYKATHLAHHKDECLTCPMEDPESYYHALWRLDRKPRLLRALYRVNNTLAGRLTLGPWIAMAAFFHNEALLAWSNARGVRLAWALHLPAVAVVLGVVWLMGIPLWVYLLGVVWPSLSIIALRTFAEHQWHETPQGRTIIVERSPLSMLFLNNNLHIVHHTHPTAPWYTLPALYRAHRAEWHALNGGYVFENYWQLWRRWAVVAKEPVAHPVLHRIPAPGQRPPEAPMPPAPGGFGGIMPAQ